MGGIANIPEDNEDNYNEDKYDFRSPPKPYEPPEYAVRKHVINKSYAGADEERFSDNNYNDGNSKEVLEAEEVEAKQEDDFETGDLKQESYENNLINKFPQKSVYDRPEEIIKTIRPAYRRGDPITNRQVQQNYATPKQTPFPAPPQYCYQPLNIIRDCFDARVVGNFWFYNFCTDECMLYATDICDKNSNKFSSLEECEETCANPLRTFEAFLRQKQLQGCRGARPLQRNFKKRKNYYE